MYVSFTEQVQAYSAPLIGWEALLNVLRHPALKGLPFYLETPFDDAGHKEEIRRIREAL